MAENTPQVPEGFEEVKRHTLSYQDMKRIDKWLTSNWQEINAKGWHIGDVLEKLQAPDFICTAANVRHVLKETNRVLPRRPRPALTRPVAPPPPPLVDLPARAAIVKLYLELGLPAPKFEL